MAVKKSKGLDLSKNIVTMLFLFVQSIISAQVDVYGDWRIDKILGLDDFQEYSMVRKEEQNHWGNLLTLNLNGTFLSGNRALCGNDIFRSVSGDFIKIDDSHIRFIVKRKSSTSFNKVNNSESKLNEDLGIFYIYKDSNSIRLIPSNGVLKEDKDKMRYAQMLDSFGKEWKKYDFVWESTAENQPDEILKDCKDKRKEIDLSNYRIVFSKPESYGNVFLLRENENYHYMVYDAVSKRVSLAYPK
ncbi:hypothetical protein [uncultured Flavobacterium sp.]|uniref:hypothetical protein n=1 Tax=uncultured Flavobacterium sp. TaxID=165435 RepID=UPI0025F8BC7F|nr:hypothetical protein [uncultured Flavobacterium sp.]